MLRCQSMTTSHLSTAPEGGRIDFLGTLSRSPVASLTGVPSQWSVQRTRYFAETSTNLLVAAILHRVATCIKTYCHHVELHWGLRAREDYVLQHAARELRNFFELTPLGAIAQESLRPIERLTEDATRRRAEFVRIESIVTWWQEFKRYDLSMLRSAGEQESVATVTVDGCYELLCTTALLLALRDRLSILEDEPEPQTLRFRAPFGTLSLKFGTELPMITFGRPLTALLSLQPDGGTPVPVIIEARNAQGDTAQEYAGRMRLLKQVITDPQVRLLLLTPAGGEARGSDAVRWQCFAPALCLGAPVDAVREWHILLNELLSPIEKGA